MTDFNRREGTDANFPTVEIIRTANGYIVRPPMEYHRCEYANYADFYVFNDFGKMTDKLDELLNPEKYRK